MRRPSARFIPERWTHGLRLGAILLLGLVVIAPADATDAGDAEVPPQADTPTLQLGQWRFPELLMHMPVFDGEGNRLPLACDQIRARRIDELDPTWKRAVERIHLECQPLPALHEGAPAAIATVVTAYLRPGSARFLEAPVVEVRLMDSDLWSDHQYVLGAPYAQIADALQRHLVARCEAAPADQSILSRRDCTVTRSEDGMFIADTEVGGAWVYPDPFDAQRTVYAEGWAE